jgi:hypothetical protein
VAMNSAISHLPPTLLASVRIAHRASRSASSSQSFLSLARLIGNLPFPPKSYHSSRNFRFAFPATTVYCQLPLLRSFSAFVPEPKNRTRWAGAAVPERSCCLPYRVPSGSALRRRAWQSHGCRRLIFHLKSFGFP